MHSMNNMHAPMILSKFYMQRLWS